MKDRRTQCFFWLGVFVLPVFWSWFTLGKAFSRRERLIAFLWLAVFGGWLLHQRDAVVGQLQTASVTYPAVLGWLTVALGVWLFFRIRFVPTIIELIILIDVLAIVRPSMLFADRMAQPFDWRWLLPPVIAALAHLAVEPIRRWRTRRSAVAGPLP